MEIDDAVNKRDDEALVKALVNPEDGIEYRGNKTKPLIQILKNGCWFIQKGCRVHGLGKSRLDTLIQKIKKNDQKDNDNRRIRRYG